MTRKSELYRDLTYEPDAITHYSLEMQERLSKILPRAGPLNFSETVAGALAMANKGAARNLKGDK